MKCMNEREIIQELFFILTEQKNNASGIIFSELADKESIARKMVYLSAVQSIENEIAHRILLRAKAKDD